MFQPLIAEEQRVAAAEQYIANRGVADDYAEVRIARKRRGEDFDRDDAIEARVARLVDLSHASGPKERDDFVVTEASAWRDGHGRNREIICLEPLSAVRVLDSAEEHS